MGYTHQNSMESYTGRGKKEKKKSYFLSEIENSHFGIKKKKKSQPQFISALPNI